MKYYNNELETSTSVNVGFYMKETIKKIKTYLSLYKKVHIINSFPSQQFPGNLSRMVGTRHDYFIENIFINFYEVFHCFSVR